MFIIELSKADEVSASFNELSSLRLRPLSESAVRLPEPESSSRNAAPISDAHIKSASANANNLRLMRYIGLTLSFALKSGNFSDAR